VVETINTLIRRGLTRQSAFHCCSWTLAACHRHRAVAPRCSCPCWADLLCFDLLATCSSTKSCCWGNYTN